jgi:multidrug resistance protein, MATE family
MIGFRRQVSTSIRLKCDLSKPSLNRNASRPPMTNRIPAVETDFQLRPHRTFLWLSVPVLFSMVAEPVTGLVDTAFVARLGAGPLAALGVGSMLLSAIFWVFNFLGIGSQTEVGHALGRNHPERAAEIGYLALLVGLSVGTVLILVFRWWVPVVTAAMGAEGEVQRLANRYVEIRLFGAPAVLITVAAFGIMRGVQDMRTPLWIAVGINLVNILLDALLIFGLGPFPALGITGAALATVISQWLGALAVFYWVLRRLERPERLRVSDVRRLVKIGGDLFVRTGLLLFYLAMATRTATRIGAEAGAAHQAIRQFWTFTALFLDAYSVTAQSLIAFFIGRDDRHEARRTARMVCLWSFLTGCGLMVVMILGQSVFIHLLVPPEAVTIFVVPWLIAACSQPINSLAFATDGVHWGTGDFAYLRNGMIAATGTGLLGIFMLEQFESQSLTALWLVTVAWIAVRAGAGVIRIWPGIGRSPLRPGWQSGVR